MTDDKRDVTSRRRKSGALTVVRRGRQRGRTGDTYVDGEKDENTRDAVVVNPVEDIADAGVEVAHSERDDEPAHQREQQYQL